MLAERVEFGWREQEQQDKEAELSDPDDPQNDPEGGRNGSDSLQVPELEYAQDSVEDGDQQDGFEQHSGFVDDSLEVFVDDVGWRGGRGGCRRGDRGVGAEQKGQEGESEEEHGCVTSWLHRANRNRKRTFIDSRMFSSSMLRSSILRELGAKNFSAIT